MGQSERGPESIFVVPENRMAIMGAVREILYHTTFVLVVLLCGSWFGIQYATGTEPVNLILVALTVVMVAVGVLRYQSPDRTDNTTIYDVKAARRAYTEGRIPLEEMERRVNVALDPQSKQLRKYVEEVKGVGPEISAALSAEYRSTEDLSKASKTELEEIYGIGPNTAHAIKQQFEQSETDERTETTRRTSHERT